MLRKAIDNLIAQSPDESLLIFDAKSRNARVSVAFSIGAMQLSQTITECARFRI